MRNTITISSPDNNPDDKSPDPKKPDGNMGNPTPSSKGRSSLGQRKPRTKVTPTSVPKVQLPSEEKAKLSLPVNLPGYNPGTYMVIDLVKPGTAAKCWLIAMTIVAIVAQLRVASIKLDAQKFKQLESVRYYNQKLARNPDLVATLAAYAINNTKAALDPTSYMNQLNENFTDLTTNLSGAAKMAGTELTDVITDPVKLRILRRGLMLSYLGTLQAIPATDPTKIHSDVRLVDIGYIIKSCPFNVTESREEVIKFLSLAISSGNIQSFSDGKHFSTDDPYPTTKIESELGCIHRTNVNNVIDTSGDPDIDDVTDPFLKLILEERKSKKKT